MFIKKNHIGILSIIVLSFLLLLLSQASALTPKSSDTLTDSGQVAAAQAALVNTQTLNPIEGDDTNILPIVQNIVDAVSSGVTVTIHKSSNRQVDNSGSIIYGISEVEGSVTFTLTKNYDVALVDIIVKIPAEPLTNYINVIDYGAKGDGITDDTTAIQNAINYAYLNKIETVYIPDGTYQINPDVSIYLKSNISLILANSAVLRSTPSADNTYEIINITDVSNVSVSGGSIVGDRYIHNGSRGRFETGLGMAIGILGSNNINISDIAISDCWGDGIYLGSSKSQNFCDTVSILRVTLNNNRRQGITIISAQNLLLKDSTATNCNGTDPQSGLDLEPNYSTQFLQNIVIDNFHTAYNVGYGITSYFGQDSGVPLGNVSITIKDHCDVGSRDTLGNIMQYIRYGYNITVI